MPFKPNQTKPMKTTPSTAMATTNTENRLHSLGQIKRAAESAGSHWFSKSAMRYFSSRVGSHVYSVPGGALFVSSEKDLERRLYSVRSCTAAGVIDTVGMFCEYKTNRAAHKAALNLVMGGFSL